MEWIDKFVIGIFDIVESTDIYVILDYLDIDITYLPGDSILLCNSEAFYSRNINNRETIFIRHDLPKPYEKFVLAHELGHAILHTRVFEAAYRGFMSEGKLENEANYFAIKLLDIELDPVYYDGFTKEALASALYIHEDAAQFL